jgi:hypothetical protein
MKTLAISSMILMLVFASFQVKGVELRDGHPEIYIVKKGDTLWDISAMFLDKPWLWPEIWHVNPQVNNPHLIYPGDELQLIYVDGKPRIVRATSDQKLSPQMRVLSAGDAIPTIPLDSILPFLNSPRILDQDTLDSAPYILGADSQRLIFGEGNQVYVRGTGNTGLKGYSLFRKGGPYTDPDSGEVLGFEAMHLGTGRMVRSGDPATMMIKDSVREILRGDRALPYDDRQLPPVFMLRAPEHNIEAKIISVYNGVENIGTYDVVILNKGRRENMDVGHVLTVMQAGEVVEDNFAEDKGEMITLPSEIAGELMIFRTFEKTSLALIMRSNRPIHLFDTAVTPQ